MQSVRIRKQIESETITLPELRPFVGTTVEIIVSSEIQLLARPGTGDWSALVHAASELEGYDFDAWQRQRELDCEHGPGFLP